MKRLADIISEVHLLQDLDLPDVEIASVCLDSRKCEPGSMFVALRGTQVDGHRFIGMAIEKGAIAVVCEELPEDQPETVTFIQVADSSKALGLIADAFYDHPSRQLQLIGITGTNGKTTTATLLYEATRSLGYKCGLLSTVRNYVHDKAIEATHTTPDAIQINALLAEMVSAGCSYCFMEVSSHAIAQARIEGLHFAGGVFTNISRDHLDYHKTFKDYIAAKQAFFTTLPEGSFALTNADDRNGDIMMQNTRANVARYGVKNFADYKARIIETHFEGTQILIDEVEVWTFFVGIFNVYNLLSVYAVLLKLGFRQDEVLKVISELRPVEGRFETLRSAKGHTAIVDYAHTPDALENVLKAIDEIRGEEQQLFTVVGTGGNRDKGKRPEMARIAAQYSHRVVLTSDNPRYEKPEDIIEDMKQGLDEEARVKTLSIINRAEAIRTAILFAQPGDVVLIAGKGHETYQEVEGVKHHFDDREIVMNLYKELK